MPRYGPAKRLRCGWAKVGVDCKGRKHVFLAQYPWHLEKFKNREHSHYWEHVPGGKICQQMIHSKAHVLPHDYDAGDPSNWTEAAMRHWFEKVVHEYDAVREAVFFYKTGDMYEGEINFENEPHGFGVYTTKEGVKHVGRFDHGKFVK